MNVKRRAIRGRLAALILTAVAAGTLQGSVVLLEHVSVTADTGHYRMSSAVTLPVPANAVRAVLTRFDQLRELNPDLEEVRLLPGASNGEQRMRVRSTMCVLFFCQRYRWTQRVQLTEGGDILTRFERGSGDFREGWVLYRVSAQPDGRTRLEVDAHLVPDKPLPSLFGESLMQHRLENQAMQLAMRVVEAASGSARARLHTPRFRVVDYGHR